MSKHHPTLENAVETLEDLASDQDEIIYENDETTPADLLDMLSEDMSRTPKGSLDRSSISTENLRIGFTQLDGTYVPDGTFADMIKDRMG